jgi:Cu/Ag efflux pump CusA
VLPIALQDEFWAWLWYTMIFGLFAGSAMTLFVIPSLYYMIFVPTEWEKRVGLFRRIWRKIRRKKVI